MNNLNWNLARFYAACLALARVTPFLIRDEDGDDADIFIYAAGGTEVEICTAGTYASIKRGNATFTVYDDFTHTDTLSSTDMKKCQFLCSLFEGILPPIEEMEPEFCSMLPDEEWKIIRREGF